eukprot:366131-Chlamydomonas_euryale.AAC.14
MICLRTPRLLPSFWSLPSKKRHRSRGRCLSPPHALMLACSVKRKTWRWQASPTSVTCHVEIIDADGPDSNLDRYSERGLPRTREREPLSAVVTLSSEYFPEELLPGDKR